MDIAEARATARQLCDAAREEEAGCRPAAAADSYRAAITVLEAAVGPDDADVVAAKQCCVSLLVEMGRDAEAAALSASSLPAGGGRGGA